MTRLLKLPFTLLALLLGRISWSAPPWLLGLRSLLNTHRKGSAVLLVVCIATAAGYIYYDSLPKPVMVKAETDGIGITGNSEDAKPDPLELRFDYDYSALNPDQERPAGYPSVARIDLVGEKVAQGISISPMKPGSWTWLDDRRLRFTPETDWPAGTEYTVSFDEAIFSQGTLLSQKQVGFSTPAFSPQITSIEFYQDPVDISVRRVISTIQFSHPVDHKSLEAKLSMGMRPSDSTIETGLKPYRFSLSFDVNSREAYVQSEPVKLSQNPNFMQLKLDEGVATILGGAESTETVEQQTLIPDIYSFLKIQSVSTQIIRNASNEPEQLLLLEFTDDIEQDELLSKLSLHLLPTKGEPLGRSNWSGPRLVNAQVLAGSTAVKFRILPNERNYSKLYSLVIDVPERRYLYLKISKGLTSVNKFVHRSFYDDVITSPAYPLEARIAGVGSILSYSGEQQLSVLTRGLSAVKFVIGKMVDGQLNHLVSQADGDMSNPRFTNWSFNEQNITEIDSLVLNLGQKHPAKANYFSIDLNQYLPRGESRFGLFFVEIRGWDKKRKREIRNVIDKRLILVTDLGIIVKNNADRSHDLFVQSIADGAPVAHASVELLGKNGLPIFSGRTDLQGHVALPSTKGFQREKQPTVYVVNAANDFSFIPYNRNSRQINLSRFDIGGVRPPAKQEDALNAFLFSDRGMYRPGETVNLGMVVKNFDMSNVEDIPLEVVIVGPRHQEALVRRITLPERGFLEFQFATEATTITGIYYARLHLVRGEKHRGRQIGSVRFDVEEFQPDTMKITSELLDVTDKGWNTQQQLQSRVVVTNLFGTPAQDRKVSARLIIQPHNFMFKGYQDYQFTNPFLNRDKDPISLDKQLPDQRSNADGEAAFDIDLTAFREGTYRLNFIAEGFDQAGGRSVIASNRALISPLETIVGFKADGDLGYINADSDRKVELIAVDKSLQRTAANGLKMKLIGIQQVSTLVKQKNNTYKYQSVTKETELSSAALNIGVDGYEYSIDSHQPGDFAVEVFDANELKLARFEFSVVGFANLAGKIDRSADLQLKLDKQDYAAGELISMNIRAPYAGAGLITIESDRVHHFKWFQSSSESSMQTIRIPQDLEGTGYVNVAFVRDAGSPEILTSPLSYAVQPFSIDKSRRRIDVQLETEDIVRPGKPMKIGFSTSRPSRIAVFAVNEGILQVAGYKTPMPLEHFMRKRSLSVGTLQTLDLILPEFDLVRALSAAGGGAMMAEAMLAQNLNPFVRKTDKPAVFWAGIHEADSERRTVEFVVPDTFAGELRVMAVAVSEDAVGSSSRHSLARGPFVISPSLLTQAAPGDEFEVTVGIANIIEGSGEKAPIDLAISNSEHLEIIGETSTRLEIDEGGEGRYRFRVRARAVLGAAEIKFSVKHGDEDASRTASLSVRPATNHETLLQSGFSEDKSMELELRRSLMPELSEQSITASASPLAIVDGLTTYLDNFPHGCTEQVVSKVFPLVGLMAHPAYAAQVPEVEAQFAHLIDKLRERQLADGGFAFWPGHSRSADYPSVYVMHFLLESGDRGNPVPADMLQRGKSFLESLATRKSTSLAEARTRANAIYLLTRMGQVTTNYVIDLEESLQKSHPKVWRRDLAAAYMAATYQLIQKSAEADRLIADFELGKDDHQALDDFHSALAIDAQFIYLLAKHFPGRAAKLDGDSILQMTTKIFKGQYNTISSAYAILALGAYSELTMAGNYNESIEFSAIDAAGQLRKLEALALPFLTAEYGIDARKLKLAGEAPMYYLNLQAGFDDQLPPAAISEGIEIYRDFIDDEGNPVTSFEQGKELTVRLKVRALGEQRLYNIAIIDLLPGGFEVQRRSVSATARDWLADYIDIREDRVVYYGSFDTQVRELNYRVKLTSAGSFVIPPSYAESMYDHSIHANTKPGRFEVTASK